MRACPIKNPWAHGVTWNLIYRELGHITIKKIKGFGAKKQLWIGRYPLTRQPGRFGIVGKTCPIILSELSKLFRNDDGYLGNLRREDIIDAWKKTLDAATKRHVPTKRASGNLRETILLEIGVQSEGACGRHGSLCFFH